MNKGLVNFDWNNISTLKDEEITYYLMLEGKSISTICKIRNLDVQTVQRHIIDSKIKNRYMVNIRSVEDLISIFRNATKDDKLSVLSKINDDIKEKLITYIKNNYGNMNTTDKSTAVWIIGELKEERCINILLKASVHKAVVVRRMAISAMGKIKSEKCEDALARALSDSNPQVVTYAVNSLAKIRSVKHKEKVLKLKNSEKDYVKRAVDNYLNEIMK